LNIEDFLTSTETQEKYVHLFIQILFKMEIRKSNRWCWFDWYMSGKGPTNCNVICLTQPVKLLWLKKQPWLLQWISTEKLVLMLNKQFSCMDDKMEGGGRLIF